MWRSKDDVIKDLAYLNDFGEPGDKEPYKVLYSVGRGLKMKETSMSEEKFIDQRTGEVINAEDEISITNDVFYQSKGRGSLLGSFSKQKLQLQQQLRLARPLGSGDEAIESYCRRNALIKNATVSSSTSDFEPDAEKTKMSTEKPIVQPNLDVKRVKGTLNQNSYSNVLIASLLSKSKLSPVIESISERENLVNGEKNYKTDINDCKSNHSTYNHSTYNNDNNNDLNDGRSCSESSSSISNNSGCGSSVDFRESELQKTVGNDMILKKISFVNEWKYSKQNCSSCKEHGKNMENLEKESILDIDGLRIIDDGEVNEENYQNDV